MNTEISEIVTKIAEVQIKLQATDVDLASVQGNRAVLEVEMAQLKEQLTEAKKPELRDWDYGFDSFTNRKAPADPRIYMGGHHYGCNGSKQDNHPLEFVCGNALDDLKALSEDLEEFKMVEEFDDDYKINVDSYSSGKVRLSTSDDSDGQEITFDFSLKSFEEFTMKCRQKLATLKRKAAK